MYFTFKELMVGERFPTRIKSELNGSIRFYCHNLYDINKCKTAVFTTKMILERLR